MVDPIRVMVVDDSALMRQLLSDIMAATPGVQVVGTARDGTMALERIPRLNPDVITLDVEMPGMNGLDTLASIMHHFPRPVIMVSALAQSGAQVSLRALELGAVDLVAKPGFGQRQAMDELRDELPRKVMAAFKASPLAEAPEKMKAPPAVRRALGSGPEHKPGVLAIASSTGGPAALNLVLTRLPANFPLPVVVAQHMPVGFTRHLAQRLDSFCALEVQEARDGQEPQPGQVLIAPAGQQVRGVSHRGQFKWQIEQADSRAIYRPSADILFSSVAEVWGERVLALVLTGMGNDGRQGLETVKRRRGYVLAQSRETCVIYGMPRAAVEAGLADEVLDLPEIPARLEALAAGTGREGA